MEIKQYYSENATSSAIYRRWLGINKNDESIKVILKPIKDKLSTNATSTLYEKTTLTETYITSSYVYILTH